MACVWFKISGLVLLKVLSINGAQECSSTPMKTIQEHVELLKHQHKCAPSWTIAKMKATYRHEKHRRPKRKPYKEGQYDSQAIPEKKKIERVRQAKKSESTHDNVIVDNLEDLAREIKEDTSKDESVWAERLRLLTLIAQRRRLDDFGKQEPQSRQLPPTQPKSDCDTSDTMSSSGSLPSGRTTRTFHDVKTDIKRIHQIGSVAATQMKNFWKKIPRIKEQRVLTIEEIIRLKDGMCEDCKNTLSKGRRSKNCQSKDICKEAVKNLQNLIGLGGNQRGKIYYKQTYLVNGKKHCTQIKYSYHQQTFRHDLYATSFEKVKDAMMDFFEKLEPLLVRLDNEGYAKEDTFFVGKYCASTLEIFIDAKELGDKIMKYSDAKGDESLKSPYNRKRPSTKLYNLFLPIMKIEC